MTRSLLVMAVVLAGCISTAFAAEVRTTQDIAVIHYLVGGNTASSFFKDDNTDYLYNGIFDVTDKKGDEETFFHLSYRSTDDKLTDPQDMSLEQFYLGKRRPNDEILLGDYYENFSEYSMANALKGMRYQIGSEQSARLKVVAGVDMPRWEDLWEKRQDDSSYRKYVWGSQFSNDYLEKKLRLDVNYAGAADDAAYLRDATSGQSLTHVSSVAGRYLASQVATLYFEQAMSLTKQDLRQDGPASKPDGASKASLELNWSKYALTSKYSRIGNNFRTTGGMNTTDQEAVAFDGTAYLPLSVRFEHYLHADRDNLRKHKTTTTRQLNPGGKLTFTLPEQFELQTGYDLRDRDSSDRTTDTRTCVLSAVLGKYFSSLHTTAGYARTHVRNRTDATQESDADSLTFAADSSHLVRNVNVTWSLAETFSRQENLYDHKADWLTAHAASLRAAFPSTLTIETRASINDSDYYRDGMDARMTEYFLSLSRNVRNNLVFNVMADRKKYTYQDPSSDYWETQVMGRLTYQF